MNHVHFDDSLDARGLKCPMPVVKARRKVGELKPGQILRVISNERESIKDFQGWARFAESVELLAQETETKDDGEIYLHFVRKTSQ